MKNTNGLPCGDSKKALEFPHFPTRLQAVVWRNWGLVKVEKLAQVLKATPKQIEGLAADMGLIKDDSLCPIWHERGYLTIIRRNWHLLPYEQILGLLEWSADEMAYVLKEEDFLYGKLGQSKPQTEPIYYRDLSQEEKTKTADLRDVLNEHFKDDLKASEAAFGFLKNYGKNRKNAVADLSVDGSGLRFIYSYSAIYGDPLLNEKLDPYPDGLLADYAASGINGIWLQGILYNLVPWCGESKYSVGWEKRQANLRNLCLRAQKYGIKVYLYLNEPRSMPADFFESHPDWRGVQSQDGLAFAMCTSTRGVLDSLRDGVAELVRNIPEIGGFFTITMSENLTTCASIAYRLEKDKRCPKCSPRGAPTIIAEVNKAIADGAHSVQPGVDVIAWSWAWDPEWDAEVVSLLPKDVKVMCVSESGLPSKAMGIEGVVWDYAISKVGPGPIAAHQWKKAQERGMAVAAKIQVNNTWECSAVPYIPVPGLVEKHLRNLESAGVKDFMLSWTLGGYPGGNVELFKMSKDKLAVERYGEAAAPFILKAWDCFDSAFEEFPLNGCATLYTAPQNFGPMSLLAVEPTGYKATMIGFPYDDLESWRAIYPEDIFEEQFRKLSTGWADGLKRLSEAGKIIPSDRKAAFEDLANVAEAAYCHFRSTYLQIRFVRLRNAGNWKAISTVLDEEIELARRLYAVVQRDSRTGFEASNHYYYTANDLKEKILNCEQVREAVRQRG